MRFLHMSDNRTGETSLHQVFVVPIEVLRRVESNALRIDTLAESMELILPILATKVKLWSIHTHWRFNNIVIVF